MDVQGIPKPVNVSAQKRAKLCNWISSSFGSASSVNDLDDCRKRKHAKCFSQKVSQPNENDDTWLQRYAPQLVEDLAVHKKKILEVETWITQHKAERKGGAPILLMAGPSGCGKTATLMVVAHKHGIAVEEWSNPLTTPFNVTREAGLQYQSEVSRFEEFLFRSGKYNSVVSDPCSNESSNKIVLCEDLPNYLYRDPSRIVDLLRKYKSRQRSPLVIIISHGGEADSITRQLRTLPIISIINFNPISATLLSKTLSRICANEKRSVSKDDIAMMSSCGDVRAAINGLQFSSQFERLKVSENKRKKTPKANSTCIAAKDTTMILFRALGKIFYCKREKRKGSRSNSKTYRDPLIAQPENVLEQCCLSGSAFSLFLHQNYLNFFDANSIDDVTNAAEYLSVADSVNSPLTSSDPSSGASFYMDRYEGVLAARGLIYSNSSRATSDLCSSFSGCWRPMHKPSWFEVRRQEQDNRITAHCLFWRQQEDLPLLTPLASRFDTPQKNFLRQVIAIPKWQSFKSFDRLGEQDAGNDEPEEEAMSSGDVAVKMEVDEDDDVIIEEFSD